MTIHKLYITMGELSLYIMRDELLDWMHQNNYNLRTEIVGDVLKTIPNKFIYETKKTRTQLKVKILQRLSGKGNEG